MIDVRRVDPGNLDEFEQTQIDLTNHAINRIEAVIKDASQLMEGPHQLYALLLSIAGTLIRSAALVRQQAQHERTGKEPPSNLALRHVLLDLLRGLGITAREEEI